ncbi:glycosyltransferase [Paraflavitalea pollutisoli]|uniref:glycosyltransferase n=1 Tax=Paraflavitalea pollutisoli TaxID=3034143 RepID=UPI0023EBC763|nr:glycosyltransferase [Paraflavitalea sp. H1-2-19X]
MPTVSIYITTKNRPQLLERAILSVVRQSYQDIEVLVVDDGSDCDNQSIIDRVQQQTNVPVRYFRNEVSKGACYSRNLAIDAAKGQFVTGLDDDDEFVVNRIEVLLKSYDNKYAFVAANDNLILVNGKITHTQRLRLIKADTLLDAGENLIGNQVFTEKARWQAIGGFDVQFPAFQDFDTFYRLIRQFGPGLIIPDRLQNIYRNDTVIKITTLKNQLKGLSSFYKKHKADMNSRQRKRFILRYRLIKAKLLGAKGSKVSMLDIVFCSGLHSLKANLIMYIKSYLKPPKPALQ